MEQRLAHYQIGELLGEGSFAWVYRALDEKFERHVALKILKPIWLSDPQAIARFKQEAKTMAKLRHTHIVDVFDVGESEGQIYLSQLLVEGETLAERLAREPLTWDETTKIVTAISSALDYAHSQGIVHRDIKPHNILLDAKNEAYLGDFGLVRAVEGSASLSASGNMIGTGHYMAPEIWDGKEATPAADIYALSCVVFEMLKGEALFEGSSMVAVMKKHIMGPELPDTWPAGIPNGINEVLRRGLAEEPTARITRAGDLAKELAALSVPVQPAIVSPAAKPTSASVPPATAPDTTKSGPPWLLIGGAVVIVLVIGAIAFFALSSGTSTPEAPDEVPTVNTQATIEAANGTATAVAAVRTKAADDEAASAAAQATDTPTSAPPTDTPEPPTTTPIPPSDTPESPTDTPIPVPPTATPIPPTSVAATGGRIFFISNRDGNSEIYMMNADGSEQTNLTNTPNDYESDATVSPDGMRFCFVSRLNGDSNLKTLYVMNVDGSEKKQIGGNDVAQCYAWSPDGTRILVATSERDLGIINADGSGGWVRLGTGFDDNNASWSPDGQRIVFAAPGSRIIDLDIFRINSDGNGQKRLTDSDIEEDQPKWSPDGQRIVFVSGTGDNAGSEEIYVMNADGSQPINLTNSPGTDNYPVWSPDGTKIAFSTKRDGNWEVYVMNADGSNPVNLTNNPASDGAWVHNWEGGLSWGP